MVWERFITLIKKNLFVPSGWTFSQPSSDALGTIWQGRETWEEYKDGNCKSRTDGTADRLRIAFRNASPMTLLLCWISESGDLKHFYKLAPSSLDRTYYRTP